MSSPRSERYFGRKNAVTSGELIADEVVVCPLCSTSPRPFAVDYQGFRLCRCDGCSLEFVTPRLRFEELADKVYSDNYFPVRDGSSSRSAESTHYFGRQLSNFERLLGGRGKILDIGCGNGAFLDFAREIGWDISGVDIKLSPYARGIGLSTLGG